jgi:hypothetical protein
VSINQNWFSTFNQLDYTGYKLLGQWNWQLGQKLKGEISYNNRLALASFQQTNRILLHNLQNTENYILKGDYEIFPDWFLRTQFTRAVNRYYSELQQQSNVIENTKEFGLMYVSIPDNKLGFHVAMVDGKYPNRSDSSPFDNAYTRIDYFLEGKWSYSTKTIMSGQIGYTSQQFAHVTSRDFTNIIAKGDILWRVTPKSSLLLEAWRKVGPSSSVLATFQLYQGVRLTPIWKWSPKLQIELPVSYEQQTSLGTSELTDTITTPPQQAKRSIINLNLNYMPMPNVEMVAFASYEKRDSNNPLRSYQDQTVGLSMKVSF